MLKCLDLDFSRGKTGPLFVLVRSVIKCSAVNFITLHLASKHDSLVGHNSEQRGAHLLSFQQSRQKNVTRPCSVSCPTFFLASSEQAFPMNGALQEDHPLSCLKQQLQFMFSFTKMMIVTTVIGLNSYHR